MSIQVYGRDYASRVAPEIQGDVLLEVLQFMVRRKQNGLMVFDNAKQAENFAWQLRDQPNTDFLFWTPQMKAFRYEATWLRLVVLNTKDDIMRLRGQRFDRIWWMAPNAEVEYRSLVKPLLLRLTDGN